MGFAKKSLGLNVATWPHRPSKALGQNFLTSRAVVADIVREAKVTSADTILEVGPGKGVLTEVLLESAGRVIAVEKDDRLIPLLQKKFSKEIASGELKLVHADILKFTKYELQAMSYKLVANIPYYITGQLIRTVLGWKKRPETMVLMLQKEVATRIVARDGKESLLSLAVKVYGTPRYAGTVKRKFFRPEPKVDSAILVIENISYNFFKTVDEQKFFDLLHRGFKSKRKILAGNLRGWKTPAEINGAFAVCDIPPLARADFFRLIRN